MRGAISMHTPRTLWRVSQSTRNQHAINTQSTRNPRNQRAVSAQSARTQMASPRPQLAINTQSTRNQHAIHAISAQSARTQMESPRPQLAINTQSTRNQRNQRAPKWRVLDRSSMDWPLLKHLWGRGRRAEHPQAGRQLDGRAIGGAVLSTLKPIARRHWSGCNAWLSVLWISTCEIAAISAHQRPSEAIRGHQRSSEVIRGHQRQSDTICGHQRSSEAISGNQRSSEVISGHQRPSEAISLSTCLSTSASPDCNGTCGEAIGKRGRRGEHLHASERIPRLQRHLDRPWRVNASQGGACAGGDPSQDALGRETHSLQSRTHSECMQ